MTTLEAAKKLSQALTGASWLVSVGVGSEAGRDCIFLYVKKAPPKDILAIKEAESLFPVFIRKSGAFRPTGPKVPA